MDLLTFLFNAMYRAAEGHPAEQRLLVAVAQAHNDRMAEINHTAPVKALRPGFSETK